MTLRGLSAAIAIGLVGCGAPPPDDGDPDSQQNTVIVNADSAVVGKNATVTASNGLNLRSGPSTSDSILLVMPSGATVSVEAVSNGWYKVNYKGTTGWCSGTYLSPDAGGGGSPGGSSAVDQAIARAESGVGFSYHWGGGCWSPGSSAHGACYGSCPNCSHSGTWGADCSGYVAKIWQVPGASALTTCEHPYSTVNFYNEHTHWADVSRANVKRGDAFVHNSGSEGHIFLYDSGDAWGWAKAYEAKGCSYGIQHDTRMVYSYYKAIRRDGY
ncbi:MAG TPA: SH3 domain-containing protein [Polyangia bacterium]|nr:SH3 domain-containing protein [Polyangia bacterium]